MKIMICPINGARAITEFSYGGELRPELDPNTASDRDWAGYLFDRDNLPQIKREWWCHTPSNTWFIAERHTLSDQILQTYLWGEAE